MESTSSRKRGRHQSRYPAWGILLASLLAAPVLIRIGESFDYHYGLLTGSGQAGAESYVVFSMLAVLGAVAIPCIGGVICSIQIALSKRLISRIKTAMILICLAVSLAVSAGALTLRTLPHKTFMRGFVKGLSMHLSTQTLLAWRNSLVANPASSNGITEIPRSQWEPSIAALSPHHVYLYPDRSVEIWWRDFGFVLTDDSSSPAYNGRFYIIKTNKNMFVFHVNMS